MVAVPALGSEAPPVPTAAIGAADGAPAVPLVPAPPRAEIEDAPAAGAEEMVEPIGRGADGKVGLKDDSLGAAGPGPALAIGARPTSSVFMGVGA